MEDVRKQLIGEIKSRLDVIGIPVFSVVPNDYTLPYIFIGNITTTEIENKSAFFIEGLVSIELYVQAEYSLVAAWDLLDQIKQNLQTVKGDKLPNLSKWNLDNDTGLQLVSEADRVYMATLQYRFKI